MELELPAIPAGVLTLIAFFLPYAQAILQRPGWSETQKKLLSIGLALGVTAVALGFYYLTTGDLLPSWPVFILLVLVVSQTSYSMLLRPTAKKVESTVNTGGAS